MTREGADGREWQATGVNPLRFGGKDGAPPDAEPVVEAGGDQGR
jgi:hypothetical protein